MSIHKSLIFSFHIYQKKTVNSQNRKKLLNTAQFAWHLLETPGIGDTRQVNWNRIETGICFAVTRYAFENVPFGSQRSWFQESNISQFLNTSFKAVCKRAWGRTPHISATLGRAAFWWWVMGKNCWKYSNTLSTSKALKQNFVLLVEGWIQSSASMWWGEEAAQIFHLLLS